MRNLPQRIPFYTFTEQQGTARKIIDEGAPSALLISLVAAMDSSSSPYSLPVRITYKTKPLRTAIFSQSSSERRWYAVAFKIGYAGKII